MKKLSLSIFALLMPIAVVNAVEEFQLKEGLWSIHTKTIDNPGNEKTETDTSICRDHAYDERVRAMAAKQPNCKVSATVSGATRTSETECTVAGTVIKSKGVATISGDTAAHSETHATYTPPMYGKSETTMIMDQKYIGACPAGMQPGDRMSADGKIIHRSR